MNTTKIVFVTIASIFVLINAIRLIFEEDDKALKFNAALGWFCAILYAI